MSGWAVWSDPDPYPGISDPAYIVRIVEPNGREHKVDLSRITRNGQFQPIIVDGQVMPVMIGWYKGGKHQGYNREGRWTTYTVPAGFYGLWQPTTFVPDYRSRMQQVRNAPAPWNKDPALRTPEEQRRYQQFLAEANKLRIEKHRDSMDIARRSLLKPTGSYLSNPRYVQTWLLGQRKRLLGQLKR
jgi:hypothetical protein